MILQNSEGDRLRGLSKDMSFQSKILSVLLTIIILLSGFSLFLVQKIDSINSVSTMIKDENIPEMVWLSHWEKELMIKEFIVGDYLSGNSPTLSSNLFENPQHEEEQIEGEIPDTLLSYKRELDLLDFMIVNNAQYLILFGEVGEAKTYIEQDYFPQLYIMKQKISDKLKETINSLNNHTDKFSVIIEQSLWLLLTLTVLSVTISIIAAYRISASLTRPVEAMVSKVDRIANGEYGLTIEGKSQIELEHLTSSINQMSIKLEESFLTILSDKTYREQILDSLPVGIIVLDYKTSLMSLNTSGKALLQIDESRLNNKEIHCNENQEFWNLISTQQLCKNKKVSYETVKGKSEFLFSHSELLDQDKTGIGRIFYFIDITENAELEKRMHQSEKLALVGEIAAGAAHEIRNPLAVIHGFLSLMNQTFSEKDREQFHLALLIKEIDRINLIVEEMLLQAKPGAPVLREVSVINIFNEVLPLMEHLFDHEEVKFITDFDDQRLYVDSKQIKQAIYNLIRNSLDAMDGKGTINIYSKTTPQRYQLYIKDSGPGIQDHMKTSLFEPFSSSKESGTGLGLTIVQRIVENHGGEIAVFETSEKGTTFIITLPIKL
ncbi:sensor histidine kinase [Litchfieldia salsa]|uniref:histidine kinase n=1 Tax=Litchfieldia salsa TaxID=930152 RepID=A0A1H0VWE6_9BACI|nr:sensor histidine kinase [Litchfieldia salsa]SDP82869.1 two-component system, NtrC family, sensor histidine kinase AtoS [Litchfieldia salsa]